MRVLTDELGGSALTQGFLARAVPGAWYPSLSGASLRDFLTDNARAVAAEFKGTGWLGNLRDAFGGDDTPAAARLGTAAKNGLVVTTGQQPGLFGGPLYTLSKAITALALADRLEELTGLPVAPVFWAATDDADFAEASSVIIPFSEGPAELRAEKVDAIQRPLASEPLHDIHPLLEQFIRGAGSSSNSRIIELVRASYRSGENVGGAYVALLRGILEPLGISVLDAAHVRVRTAGRALLSAALANARGVEAALAKRNAEIREGGFKVQVREVRGRSLVFRYSDSGKERIPVASAGEAGEPGDLSATVLLRPVVERAILPTAAYLGGPAEIAYFAQVSAVADALQARQPTVVPRWAGTVIEPRVEKILERYKITPRDFADPHKLETVQARKSIPENVRMLVQRLRSSAEAVSSFPEDRTFPLQPVLAGLQRDISHRIERFERRMAAAVKRAGTQELHDLRTARASLYPFGRPQERAVSFVALLARYGTDMESQMLSAARAHVAGLR